jgi:hypothetical protein
MFLALPFLPLTLIFRIRFLGIKKKNKGDFMSKKGTNMFEVVRYPGGFHFERNGEPVVNGGSSDDNSNSGVKYDKHVFIAINSS